MNNKELTPQESLMLINSIINKAKHKLEEKGGIYMFWGLFISIISLSQFILLKNNYQSISWYPYLLIPVASIGVFIYYARKPKSKVESNFMSKIISALWIVVSSNIILISFGFGYALQENLIPIILMIMSIGVIISGVVLGSRILLLAGIFINLSAFVGFIIPSFYLPLFMSIISCLGVFIPGVLLSYNYKRRNEV